MRRAAVDVGSNSLLLTVAELRGGRWEPVFERAAVTGLGEGTKQSGLLGEAPMLRSLAALKEMFAQARDLEAKEICAAGTMALRIASNTGEFLERAARQGTPVVVLSGESEAELGLRAVTEDPTFSGHERLTVIDVGGHSTELTNARIEGGWERAFGRSFSMGTLGLRGTLDSPGMLPGERFEPKALLRAIEWIDETIGLEFLPGACGEAVALGATGVNLVCIRDAIVPFSPERVHGQMLTYEEISRAVSFLGALSDAERAALPGIEAGREGTIHLGALILERVLHAVHADWCRVSVRGWRHALISAGSVPDL